MDQSAQGGLESKVGRTAMAATICGSLTWAYWPTLVEMAGRWEHEPQYSHGYLVPCFSLAVLWCSRKVLRENATNGSIWGFATLLAAVTMRLVGVEFYYAWLDPLSLIPAIAGIFVLFGGWRTLRIAYPALCYLIFMIPLPYRLSIELAGPLQRVATEASTFALQVLGQPAVAEGNVILLNEYELGVVEACSGLRMLMVFFAIATAVAMFLRKPLWERTLVVASAVPIALIANILRITVTGILYETAGKEIAEEVFHDLAGWLMMPLALAMLAVELLILHRVLIGDAERNRQVPPQSEPRVLTSRFRRGRLSMAVQNQESAEHAALPERLT